MIKESREKNGRLTAILEKNSNWRRKSRTKTLEKAVPIMIQNPLEILPLQEGVPIEAEKDLGKIDMDKAQTEDGGRITSSPRTKKFTARQEGRDPTDGIKVVMPKPNASYSQQETRGQ